MMNILFPRIPLWDPDAFLKRWLPLARVFLSKFGAVLWFLVVGAALVMIAPHWSDLKKAAADTMDLQAKPENALLLWLTFVLIKFIHECGHAFATRRFGGEVHEMGIMFLVFIPTPYVDASTAWSFPNRWARMFVGAGGMIVELFVAALCAFFWLATRDSGSVWTHLAYNAMLIASVTTVLFNANPLLRYDGYYMLSDFLEIPNLQQKSREYIFGLIKRHVFRIKPTQPLPPPGQRALLFFYGIASSIYRVFVGILIILTVTWSIPVLGPLMALGGVVTWLVVPVVKLTKYLTIEPELHRKRGRAWAFTGAVATAVIVLIGLIPFRVLVSAEGYIEPKTKEVLFARTPGFVKEIRVRNDQQLKKGDVILVCESDEVLAKIAQLKQTLAAAQIRQRGAAASDPSVAAIYANDVRQYRDELNEAMRKLDELTIRAPIDGTLVAPDLEQLAGRFLQQGQEICFVQNAEQLEIRGTIEQGESQLIFAESNPEVLVRLVSRFDKGHEMVARNLHRFDQANEELPNPSLGLGGGGNAPVDPKDESGKKSTIPQFEFRADLDNPANDIVPGQRAYVRATVSERPLIWQWARGFFQIIQQRSGKSKWI